MTDHMFLDFWKNRKLIWKLSKNDFKTRYAGSYFGMVWAMVQPVVIVLVYWFVFQIGLNNATAELKQGIKVPFVLWLVSGIVPWFYFSESLSNGTNALLEYHYLVKKVVFNINILPLVKTIAALFIHVFYIVYAAFVCAVRVLSGTSYIDGGLFQSESDDICHRGMYDDQCTGRIFPGSESDYQHLFAGGNLDDADHVVAGRSAGKISDPDHIKAESPVLYRLWLSCGSV